MRILIFSLFIGMASVSSTIHAADQSITLNDFELWSTTYATDTIRVFPTGIPVNNSSCSGAGSNPDSYMVKTTLSPAAISRIYATLLSAKMSGKPVVIYTSGCEDNRPAILTVMIK